MSTTFKPDELITKNGNTYPVIAGKLRLAHEDNADLSITTELISFEALDQAVVKATTGTEKGTYQAYGVASASKDTRLVESLLELAETRAIARALRFAGYGMETCGIEELGDVQAQPEPLPTPPSGQSPKYEPENSSRPSDFIPMTSPQRRAIENISRANHWNPVEACRRIVHRDDLQSLDDLSKKEAIEVIGRFKDQMAA